MPNRASAAWSYTTKTGAGKDKILSLDGRIEFNDIVNAQVKARVNEWVAGYCALVGAEPPRNGAVFEIRQGYKSKDSKRQNGDVENIIAAWAQGYMPVFAIFSSQIDGELVLRYRNARCGILFGKTSGTSTESLFTFSRDVLGYDLVEFFKRNAPAIKEEVHSTLEALLNA